MAKVSNTDDKANFCREIRWTDEAVKKSGDIDILGVFHGSLDIEKYLKI